MSVRAVLRLLLLRGELHEDGRRARDLYGHAGLDCRRGGGREREFCQKVRGKVVSGDARHSPIIICGIWGCICIIGCI